MSTSGQLTASSGPSPLKRGGPIPLPALPQRETLMRYVRSKEFTPQGSVVCSTPPKRNLHKRVYSSALQQLDLLTAGCTCLPTPTMEPSPVFLSARHKSANDALKAVLKSLPPAAQRVCSACVDDDTSTLSADQPESPSPVEEACDLASVLQQMPREVHAVWCEDPEIAKLLGLEPLAPKSPLKSALKPPSPRFGSPDSATDSLDFSSESEPSPTRSARRVRFLLPDDDASKSKRELVPAKSTRRVRFLLPEPEPPKPKKRVVHRKKFVPVKVVIPPCYAARAARYPGWEILEEEVIVTTHTS